MASPLFYVGACQAMSGSGPRFGVLCPSSPRRCAARLSLPSCTLTLRPGCGVCSDPVWQFWCRADVGYTLNVLGQPRATAPWSFTWSSGTSRLGQEGPALGDQKRPGKEPLAGQGSGQPCVLRCIVSWPCLWLARRSPGSQSLWMLAGG